MVQAPRVQRFSAAFYLLRPIEIEGDLVGVLTETAPVASTEIRTDRRAQILRCAKEVFSKKGFHNASVSDLITQAGIARGTFYLYFTSKRDIFDTLLEDLLRELRIRIQPIDLSPGSPAPLVQLRANIRRVLELVVEEPELIQILLHHARSLDQQSAEILSVFYERVLSLIQRSLEHGMRLGLIRACDPRIVAACILGTLKEVADSLTSERRRSVDLGILAEEIVSFGLQGLLVPELTR